jgi:hypothetical protein
MYLSTVHIVPMLEFPYNSCRGFRSARQRLVIRSCIAVYTAGPSVVGALSLFDLL